MHLPPVLWRDDPKHLAPWIKCAACERCQWALPRGETACIYGGPFTEFITIQSEKD